MKAKFVRSLVLVAVLAGVLTVPVTESWAQETTGAVPITVIKIKHVRAKVMEFWLTPRKKVAPGLQNDDKKTIHDSLSLPDGLEDLESMVANDARNELWVKGTPESIRRLKKIIEFLDRPGRRLEFRTQIIEVDAAEVVGVGEVANSGIVTLPDVSKPATGPQNLVFKAEFQDKIKGLIAVGKAKVLHAAQTTVLNNSTAKMSWEENPISQRIALQATPTIQNDKTVTLFLTSITGEGEGEVNKGKINAESFITTVANIGADDTIVLRLNNFETVNSKDNERVTLLLASARIFED